MQRPQKTAKVGYRCEIMIETKSNSGFVLTETVREDGVENILEKYCICQKSYLSTFKDNNANSPY